MIFALGFLTASLCALMVLPAVNARAIRLAKRRLEGLFPLSASEMAAEKDFLRARFAVAQRRLERKVEAARASRHADMAAIGARTVEIAALARTVEERDTSLASTRATLDGVERDLETARAEVSVSLSTLQVLEGAHRDLLEDLFAYRDGKGSLTEAAAGSAADTVPPNGEPDLPMRYAALLAETEALRRARAPSDAETTALRRRITEVADAMLAQDRLPSVDAYAMPGSHAGNVPVKAAQHA